MSIGLANCKQKLFRDAALLGRYFDLLHQSSAHYGHDTVGACVLEQAMTTSPAPLSL